MKSVKVKISQIQPNPDNPRVIRDGQFDKLVKSITEFPQMLELRPIVVDENLMVLGGNMRLRAAQKAGLKELPVLKASELSEEQKQRFIIADNVGFGDWDWDKLANEWDAQDLVDWGLDVPTFDEQGTEEAEEDNYEVPETINTDIEPGDLFEIGPHRLLCGDSRSATDVGTLMDGMKADMVFTDPPYGVAYTGKTKNKLTISGDDVSKDELKKYVTQWFDNVDFAIREGAYILATVPAGPLHLVFALDWESRGWLRQIMVWNKSAMVMEHSEYHYKHEPILFGWKQGGTRLKNTDRTKTTVWDFDKPSANRDHPTMKPVEMLAYGIKNHTSHGWLIYEPFLGSGTTMVAAHQIGRKCYGIELEPRYCQVVIDRMLKLDPALKITRNGKSYKKQA